MTQSPQFCQLLGRLEDTIDGTDRVRAIEATGIHTGVKSFSFVVSLVIYKKVFGISANLSDVLQSKSIDLATATNLIQSTIDTIEGLKYDDHWGLLWQEILAFARHHNIEIQPNTNRRQRRPPAALDSFLLTADSIGAANMSESSSDSYKTSVYYATIDVIIF